MGNGWVPLVGDFDGDGRDDVVVWDPTSGDWQVALSNGLLLSPKGSWLENWAVGNSWLPFVGDFNGDGKDDLLVWDPSTGNWQVALSDGSHFVPQSPWLDGWAKGNEWVARVGDFDGDGKDDIVVWLPSTGEWQVALSTGSSFVPAPGPGDFLWLRDWAKGDWQLHVGDFNADGIDDLVVPAETGRSPCAMAFGSHPQVVCCDLGPRMSVWNR